MPRIFTFRIEGLSPYSASRRVFADEYPEVRGETPDALDARVWPLKCHVGQDGESVVIPGVQFKKALVEGSKKKGDKIKGRGASRWSGLLQTGVHFFGSLDIGVKRSKAECVTVLCKAQPSDPKSPQVPRRFPQFTKWGGTLEASVFHDSVTPEVLTENLAYAGMFNGVGRYAPRVGGHLGMFKVSLVSVREE